MQVVRRWVLAASLFFASTITAQNNEIMAVPLRSLLANQEAIGRDCIAVIGNQLYRNWLQNDKPKGVAYRQILQERLAEPLPVVIAPDGRIFLKDGHHRATMVTLEALRTGTQPEELMASVRVIKNYRGATMETFLNAEFSDQPGNGYFKKEHRNLPPSEKIKLLATRLEDIPNDPFRSLVGTAFHELGIDPRYLRDFIEFDIADELRMNPRFSLEPGMGDIDQLRVSKAKNEILSNSKIIDLLQTAQRSPETSHLAKVQIQNIIDKRLEDPVVSRAEKYRLSLTRNQDERYRLLVQAIRKTCATP